MAMREDLSLLNEIFDWHKRHGPRAIPRAGTNVQENVHEPFAKAYSSEHIYAPMGYEYDVDRLIKENGNMLFIEARALALVSAAMNGFSRKDMAQIAQDHQVSASDFITSFDDLNEVMSRGYENGIRTTEVLRKCVNALELVAHNQIRDFYDYQQEDENSLIMVMTAAKSPKLWPKTILTGYAKANNGLKNAPERELSTVLHNFTDKLVDTRQLPHDEKGPRIDWFLDRSGMLLPEVTTKALGYFNLWEDLACAVSQRNCTPVLEQVMDYCLDNPPLALRPGIEYGLRSMTIASSENITDGLGIHVYLRNKLKDTWLAPVLDSDVLKLNLLGSDDKIDVIAKLKGNFDKDNSLWDDQARLGERVFHEINNTPVERVGVAHFDAVGYLGRVVGPQDYSANLSREKTLVHLLAGLECVLGKEQLATEEMDEVRDFAVSNCRTAVRLLGNDYEFDYKAFQGLSSAGVRVLVESGLDLKKLPRMNNRDKGRVLENDLGM